MFRKYGTDTVVLPIYQCVRTYVHVCIMPDEIITATVTHGQYISAMV